MGGGGGCDGRNPTLYGDVVELVEIKVCECVGKGVCKKSDFDKSEAMGETV